jgi:WXG100 family type VII secretion target
MSALDPTRGSPAGIRAAARLHDERATSVTDQRSALAKTIGGISDAEWSGTAQVSFVTTADSIEPSFGRIASLLDSVADTLRSYADGVEAIQDEAARIRSAQASAADERERLTAKRTRLTNLVASDDAVEADTVSLHRTRNDLEALTTTDTQLASTWDALVQRRAQLDASTADALNRSDAVGVIALSATDLSAMTDAQFLAWLGRLGPDQVAALAGDDDIAERLAGMTDPKAVAAWWEGLGGEFGKGSSDEHSSMQDAFIAAFPSVIGNLNGVAYWARDRANRAELAVELAAARSKRDRLKRRRKGPGWSRSLEAEWLAAKKYYSQLWNFNVAANTRVKTKNPPITQVIAFRPGPPALGAISAGDLDRARNTTFIVPGMSTTLGDSTVVQRAAGNLLDQQRQLHASGTATVAWINYDAPANFPDAPSEVLSNSKAVAGGMQLANDLEGYRASVGGATTLNVVGHSYGSTTASLGLQRAPDLRVQSFVNLASAGMPASVPNAAATHAAHVFGGTGAEGIADLGRIGGLRFDPEYPMFGAEHLDTGPEGPFRGVCVHDPLKWKKPGDPYGYFDQKTSSLYNTAVATLNPR